MRDQKEKGFPVVGTTEKAENGMPKHSKEEGTSWQLLTAGLLAMKSLNNKAKSPNSSELTDCLFSFFSSVEMIQRS